jgi:hypothetical protein
MSGKDGYAYTGARDKKIRNVQDLARLIAQLLLLVGLPRAIVNDRSGKRKDVVGDGLDVLVRLGEFDCLTVEGEFAGPIDNRLGLTVELIDPVATRT